MTEQSRKKAVAYVRISSMRQINNESPVTQRDLIQRYADANNIEIVKWFEDIAKSGKNADRDGLQDLLKFCITNRGKIQHWIVYNMRRASRDNESYTTEVKLVLRARGITVRSATEPAVDDTKEGRFLETLLVALGQLDNEGKAETTIDNMRALTMQGYWLNAPMVGYDMCKIPNELGKLRPSLRPNAMASKVRIVLERFSVGDITKAELTRFAEKIGLRSRYGKVLTEDRIHRLLKHPIYAGYISSNFTNYELVEGKHPALISLETYETNQRILFGKNARKGETHLKVNKLYPLKGLVQCINCHKPLYASAPTAGNGQPSPRYHCARSECRGKVKSIKARQVHDDFELMLQKFIPSNGILKLYKTILIREANSQLGRLNSNIKSLRDDISRLDSARLNAIQKFTESEISIDEKNELIDHLDSQKLLSSSRLKDLERQQSLRTADIEQAINLMDNVAAQWAESELDIQIRFQNMLFPDGLVYDHERGKFGTSTISPLYRYVPTKKDLSEPEKSFLVAGRGLEPLTSWL
jgi:site-specific DNA recombinase